MCLKKLSPCLFAVYPATHAAHATGSPSAARTEMAEVISLLTSSDDDEASASAAPAPAPSLTQRAARPKKRAASRAKRGGNWRRRAGDASTASPAGPTDAAEAVLVAQLETSLSAAQLRAELLGFAAGRLIRTQG